MRELWEEIKDRLRQKVSEGSYRLWIEPLKFDRVEGNTLILKCPNQFFASWVQEHYFPYIKEDLLYLGMDVKIKLEALEKIKESARRQLHLPKFSPTEIPRPNLCERFTFDEFVVGECNHYAHGACWEAANGSSSSCRTIFLHASSGLGKSHLTQAVGHRILEKRPRARLCYLTANDFTQQVVSAIKNNAMEALKKRFYTQCDCLLIEQVHCLSGRERTQSELALALDPLIDSGKIVIFTGNQLPRAIPKLSDVLRSRLASGIITSINPPDFETRKKIVARKAKSQGVDINSETVEYLAHHLKGDIRRIESAVIGLITKSSLLKRPIDLCLAREIIHEVVGEPDTLTVSRITDLICCHFSLKPEQIRSRSRKKEIALPRQIAMYFSRKYTDSSLQYIGKQFNRDHATVLHSIKKIDKMMKTSSKFRSQMEYLTSQVEKHKWR